MTKKKMTTMKMTIWRKIWGKKGDFLGGFFRKIWRKIWGGFGRFLGVFFYLICKYKYFVSKVAILLFILSCDPDWSKKFSSNFCPRKRVFCYQNCSDLLRVKLFQWSRNTFESREFETFLISLEQVLNYFRYLKGGSAGSKVLKVR